MRNKLLAALALLTTLYFADRIAAGVTYTQQCASRPWCAP